MTSRKIFEVRLKELQIQCHTVKSFALLSSNNELFVKTKVEAVLNSPSSSLNLCQEYVYTMLMSTKCAKPYASPSSDFYLRWDF